MVCGSGRKFQLSWKAKYNCMSTTRTNVVSFAQLVQMLSSCKCPLREDSYAAFVRRLKSYLRSTMTRERLNHIAVTSCHSEIVTKLDSNQLLDEFIKKSSCTHFLGSGMEPQEQTLFASLIPFRTSLTNCCKLPH